MSLACQTARARRTLRTFVSIAALCAATASHAATFTGEFWSGASGLRNINQAIDFATTTTATATFDSTGINYQLPTGTSTLADFLGPDGASLTGAGSASLNDSVFRVSGSVDLLPGAQQFTVVSNFGFRLLIDGQQVTQANRQRGLRASLRARNPGDGPSTFELFFYNVNGGNRVSAFIDGQIAQASPIPLPAGLSLIATALAALGLLRWRQRRSFPLCKPA